MESAIEAIRKRIDYLAGPDAVERIFGVQLQDGGTPYDIAIHFSGVYLIVEAEPSVLDKDDNSGEIVRLMIGRLRKTKGTLELVCRTCLVAEYFPAAKRREAVKRAHDVGWRWDERNGSTRTFCPKHVPGRATMKLTCSQCDKKALVRTWDEQDGYAQARLMGWVATWLWSVGSWSGITIFEAWFGFSGWLHR